MYQLIHLTQTHSLYLDDGASWAIDIGLPKILRSLCTSDISVQPVLGDTDFKFCMDINQRKEQFSRAWIHAVATIAGYSVMRPDVDDDSIDLGLAARGEANTPRRPRIEIQAKCTHVDQGDDNDFFYDLKIKNYNDLRIETMVPRILVVVLVPELDFNSWMRYTDDELGLRLRAYWRSLLGYPETTNEHTVRIPMSRTNLFSPENLTAIMERANREEPL